MPRGANKDQHKQRRSRQGRAGQGKGRTRRRGAEQSRWLKVHDLPPPTMQTSTSSLSRSIDLGLKLSSTSAMRLGRVLLKARAGGSGRQTRARAGDAGLCHGGDTAEAVEALHIREAKRDRAGNTPRRASIWRGAGADMADHGGGAGCSYSRQARQSRGGRACAQAGAETSGGNGNVHMKMTSIFQRAQTRGCESSCESFFAEPRATRQKSCRTDQSPGAH